MLWAVGDTSRIGLLTSFDASDPRVGLVAGLLEKPVQMVRPEPRFQVDPIAPAAFPANRDRKCLALLTDLRAPGPLEEWVDQLITPEERGEMELRAVSYRLIRNAWANGQMVLLLHAEDPDSLTAMLRRSGDSLAEQYDVALQKAIGPAVLAAGQDRDMERYIRKHDGFEIGIPKGYLVGEDAENRVIRLYRVLEGEPARFLLIHWLPAAQAPQTPEACLDLRERLSMAYYDGDTVLRERSKAFRGTFQDRPAFLLEGVWQNDKYVIGGPFRSFGFVRGDRFYLLDTSVFNPTGAKLPYVRETLAIARTFRDVEHP
jgi:hypothetical protein